jgi:hypothetical protein
MGNMQYCAVENTTADMEQVIEILREAIDNGYHDMNSTEVDHLNEMRTNAKTIVELIDRFHTNRIKHKDHEADEAMDANDEWGIDDDDDSDDDVESEQ